MEHWKGAAGLGQTIIHLKVSEGGPVHVGGVLHISRTGGDFVWSRDMGPVRGHGEAIVGVQTGF